MESVKLGQVKERLAARGSGELGSFAKNAVLLAVAPWYLAYKLLRGSRGNGRKKEYEWKNASVFSRVFGDEYGVDFGNGPGVVISGMSGTGKSTLVKRLVAGIIEKNEGKPDGDKCSAIIMDFHGEFGFIESFGGKTFSAEKGASLSVWSLDGLSPKERILEVSSTLSKTLKLGSLQTHFLEKAATLAFEKKGVTQKDASSWGGEAPSMQEVVSACEELIEKERSESVYTLRARLVSLSGEKIFSNKTMFSFKDLLAQPSRVVLSHVRSDKAASVFVESFLSKLYAHMLASGLTNQEPRVFVVIDECHRLKSPILPQICRESRKYGLSLIVSSQSLLDLDAAIVANCANTFCFYCREPEQVEHAIGLLSHNDRAAEGLIAQKFSELKVLECMALSNEDKLPVVVSIPLFEEPERKVEEKEVERKRFSNQFLAFQHLQKLLPDEEINYNDKTVIAPYECDIALPGRQIAVHWNGLRYHSSKKQLRNDLVKNRLLEAKGWRHFTVMDDGLLEGEVKEKAESIVRKLQ